LAGGGGRLRRSFIFKKKTKGWNGEQRGGAGGRFLTMDWDDGGKKGGETRFLAVRDKPGGNKKIPAKFKGKKRCFKKKKKAVARRSKMPSGHKRSLGETLATFGSRKGKKERWGQNRKDVLHSISTKEAPRPAEGVDGRHRRLDNDQRAPGSTNRCNSECINL